MPFSTRNARYLRVSAHTVIPLYIYLDDMHIDWMSDYILQCVLADLRPDIGAKLRSENISTSAKKGTSVEVHRGDTYQFAYFFRKNEPHAVLIKSRKFISTPVTIPSDAPPGESSSEKATGKRRKEDKTAPTKARRRKGTRSVQGTSTPLTDGEEDEATKYSEGDATSRRRMAIDGPRRSRRPKRLVAGGYTESADMEGSDVDMPGPDPTLDDDVAAGHLTQPIDDINDTGQDEMNDVEIISQSTQISEEIETPEISQMLDIGAEEEEEKPKMAMKVSYQGFTIYDRCLCVVIEPWPPLRDGSRAPSRAPSLAPSGMRLSRVPPTGCGKTPLPLRERTPLFLPEIDPRRSLTPAPLPSRILPPVPLFDHPIEPDDGEETGGGMMAFSQVLHSVGGERPASADEVDNDGDVFLGDADERRGDP